MVVLEAARLAPSAHNAQSWKFIVVKDRETKQKLADSGGQSFLSQAPIIIVGVALDPESVMRGGTPAYGVDLAIAIDHMTLAAVEQGLGTCWIGSFEQEEVKNILNIPEKYKVVVLLPLGAPADEQRQKIRKDLSEIICYDSFK